MGGQQRLCACRRTKLLLIPYQSYIPCTFLNWTQLVVFSCLVLEGETFILCMSYLVHKLSCLCTSQLSFVLPKKSMMLGFP